MFESIGANFRLNRFVLLGYYIQEQGKKLNFIITLRKLESSREKTSPSDMKSLSFGTTLIGQVRIVIAR